MSHKYVLVRIYSDNPCEAFPLGNRHDGPEIFADLQAAESVEFCLGVQNDDELGQHYLPAKIIDAEEIESMEELGHPIAYLPDDTPVAVVI